MAHAQVGVIGGSGLYEIEGLSGIERVSIETPFGSPSDEIAVGTLEGVQVAFLPRHGRGHRITPSELPSQANVWAIKSLGVTHLLSVSAVGSLREEIEPRHVVIPDQLLDRTKGIRPASFFGNGVVAHIAFAEPYCPELRQIMIETTRQAGGTVHDGGTYVTMEGPQFSTKAESEFYRQIGGDLIGMTALPEAKLAKEAEICYCTVAMVTDYDCWREEEETVTVDMIVANLMANVELSKRLIRMSLPKIAAAARTCSCKDALAGAIMTQPDMIPDERRATLGLLLDKYV